MCARQRDVVLPIHHSRIQFTERGQSLDLVVTTTSAQPGGIHATYEFGRVRRELPPSSAFPNLPTAQEWLVELFTAFDYTAGRPAIDVVRIDRGEWDVRVVDDTRGQYDFVTSGPFGSGAARLDSVLLAGDVPYRWHRLERIGLPT